MPNKFGFKSKGAPAEFERDLLLERQRKGIRIAKEKGF
jgi:DNA invertase Pin-like site-specific DNA recombinase